MLSLLVTAGWMCGAAPADCTVTQVTPATHMHRSRETIIETALCNIFSVTLKPVNLTAFVRAVRRRFELRVYEAFSWGPAGMFRPDIPASMKIRRIPVNEKVRQHVLWCPRICILAWSVPVVHYLFICN